jgi:hypothetical protein
MRGYSDETPGSSGGEVPVVNCSFLIMLLLFGIFKNSAKNHTAKYFIEILHARTVVPKAIIQPLRSKTKNAF